MIAACLFDDGSSLSMYVVALHSEFNQNLDKPWLMPSVTLLQKSTASLLPPCWKHGSFHCLTSLLDQLLTRLVGAT